MKNFLHKIAFISSLVALTPAVVACGGDDDDNDGNKVTEAQVISNYADMVHLNYQQALSTAQTLKTKIDEFVAAPSAAGLEAAKTAWLAAREPYGQSEVYRFADGPIDDADGPEGQLNAWPMDEAFLDYVDGNANAGKINDVDFAITKEALIAANGATADDAVSTGYHAIEFLLWGQDLSTSGPGARPFEDYLTNGDATAGNGARRALYLQTVADILVEDLQGLVDQWKPDGAYRKTFVALPAKDALSKMMSSMGILSKGELASERMDVALQSLSQEDEHSCFSDNTHNDIRLNAKGIQNVWLGRYDSINGAGLDDLVRQANPTLATQVDTAIAASVTKIGAVPAPFDQAISVKDSAGWKAVDESVKALYAQADLLVEAGKAIGLDNISVDLPE